MSRVAVPGGAAPGIERWIEFRDIESNHPSPEGDLSKRCAKLPIAQSIHAELPNWQAQSGRGKTFG